MNKSTTVSFTGHRTFSHDPNLIRSFLLARIGELYSDGYRTFMTGMAMGFDLLAGECVIEMKKIHSDIELVAVIPCDNQTARYSYVDKKRYDILLKLCSLTVQTARDYYPGCMMTRNRYLVNNSSTLVCYLMNAKGGTFQTVNYAVSQGVPVVPVIPIEIINSL